MTGSGTWLIAGLGNPGPTYASHRHNIGAMVLDRLGAQIEVSWKLDRARAVVATGRLGPIGPIQTPVVLVKPATFMNVSGGPLSAVARYFDVPPAQVVVIHDELDLDFGVLRLKFGGGEGGHNGLRSASAALGTKDYYRIRCGIGRPPGRQDPADYVLRNFDRGQLPDLGVMIEQATAALTDLIGQGLVAAQNVWHQQT